MTSRQLRVILRRNSSIIAFFAVLVVVYVVFTTDTRVVQTWMSAVKLEKQNTSHQTRHSLDQTKLSLASQHLNYTSDTDIQMLKLYREASFENVHGAWENGVNFSYDKVGIQKKEEALRVFLVPHSHNDPGWWYTVEAYFGMYTKDILNNAVNFLGPKGNMEDMRFIYAEMSFLEMWWSKVADSQHAPMKKAIHDGRLEIVTGAWVMTDEANAHLYSMVMQLIEGHEFLNNHIGYKPTSHWSIDPFGLSPTMAYLLKQSGISNLVINRVHYSVKKFLAQSKDFEFRWRQFWAGNRTDTDVFTHMFPFSGYDFLRSCGPDPKVCCEYDFRKIGSEGCASFKTESVPITATNLQPKAEALADQYRKKAQLFQTNVLLVPWGEDFRYNLASEWKAQHDNHRMLFDYINKEKSLNMNVTFGTLKDYFDAVHAQKPAEKFDTLSGDFFTYADREDHYWSGYYTSRPFYKHMDRLLQHYLRTADFLFTLWWARAVNEPNDNLPVVFHEFITARRNHAVFQHHDGVTGTGKTGVMEDYAKKMVESINTAKEIIVKTSKALIPDANGDKSNRTIDEVIPTSRLPDKLDVTKIGNQLLLFNSLSFDREEIVCVSVDSKKYHVSDAAGAAVREQEVHPTIRLEKDAEKLQLSQKLFKLCFKAQAPALGFVAYKLEKKSQNNVETKVYANFELSSAESLPNNLVFHNSDVKVELSSLGLVQKINDQVVELNFVKYNARTPPPEHDSNDRNSWSGIYLFLPDGEAKPVSLKHPSVVVFFGALSQSVFVFANPGKTVIMHSLTLYANDPAPYIRNRVDVSKQQDFELAMRFKTGMQEDAFYSDLNGYQMIRRQRLREKLPIQAHFFPMPTAALLEDTKTRFTVHTRQPLGVGSLEPGQMDIVLDRILIHDDDRGLGTAQTDNVVAESEFLLLVEKFADERPLVADRITAYHSLDSHRTSLRLHSPLTVIASEASLEVPAKHRSFLQTPLPCDVHILTLRTSASPTNYTTKSTSPAPNAALVLHKFGVEEAILPLKETKCTESNVINLVGLLDIPVTSARQVSLSMLHEGDTTANTTSLAPMEILTTKLHFPKK